MTDTCDTCPHPIASHFDSTGKCAVMKCRCTREPREPDPTLLWGQDEGMKSPNYLPPLDPDRAWKRILGDLTFEGAETRTQLDEMRRYQFAESVRVSEVEREVQRRLNDLGASGAAVRNRLDAVENAITDNARRTRDRFDVLTDRVEDGLRGVLNLMDIQEGNRQGSIDRQAHALYEIRDELARCKKKRKGKK